MKSIRQIDRTQYTVTVRHTDRQTDRQLGIYKTKWKEEIGVRRAEITSETEYINSAIREMNEETANAFNDFYRHIEEWRTYGGAILDMLRVRGIEQDVIDNIISHTPQLVLSTLPQIIPADEGRATKKRKATIRKSDQQLIEDTLNSVAYDAVDAPTIHEPINQMNYDLPALKQVLCWLMPAVPRMQQDRSLPEFLHIRDCYTTACCCTTDCFQFWTFWPQNTKVTGCSASWWCLMCATWTEDAWSRRGKLLLISRRLWSRQATNGIRRWNEHQNMAYIHSWQVC